MVVCIISGLVGITPSSGPTSGLGAGQHSTWEVAFHGEGSPGVSMRGGPVVTAPRLINAIAPTGHQDDLPTANPTPQRRWGAVELRYPPAL